MLTDPGTPAVDCAFRNDSISLVEFPYEIRADASLSPESDVATRRAIETASEFGSCTSV